MKRFPGRAALARAREDIEVVRAKDPAVTSTWEVLLYPHLHALWLHRLAYPAVALTALHAFFGAVANGHLSVVWLGGITLAVPALTLALLRFLPPRTLERIGLVEEQVA